MLKSYLLLADVVASNSVGTHTGYAVFLKKPFWVVNFDSIFSFYRGAPDLVASELKTNMEPVLTEERMSYLEFEDQFRNEEYSLSPHALSRVSSLWGFDDVLSRELLYRAVF